MAWQLETPLSDMKYKYLKTSLNCKLIVLKGISRYVRRNKKKTLNSIRHLPHPYIMQRIVTLFCSCPKTFTKLWYRVQPSTLIQKNVASRKYCISAAINWQPARDFTCSIPAKNVMSNANKENEKHSRTLVGNRFLRLLKKRQQIFQ